jgi:hypothetical protein
LLEVARRCRDARLSGTSESPHLDEAARVSAEIRNQSARSRVGNSYFIGKCLLDRRDRRALPYLKRSVMQNPWNWRHWAALAGAALLCRSSSPERPFIAEGRFSNEQA